MTAQTPELCAALQRVAQRLDRTFLDKREIIRLMVISVLAGEHLILVGPPGTAKSALIRALAGALSARYFEYLLTRFTEPNELFGPVDMVAFREGTYRRRVEGMLPEAELVFLDEVFKANSAILNSLLTLLNERRYAAGSHVVRCPLIAVFGASNEVPSSEELGALFDRFLLRVRSDNLDSFHFHNLVRRGVALELAAAGPAEPPLLSADEVRAAQRAIVPLLDLPEQVLTTYKGLIFQIRSEGISISDRRVVKLTKLLAASALFDGRDQVCEADLFVLRHIWNTLEQAQILAEIVSPVVDRYYREHPDEWRLTGTTASLEDLLGELVMIRDLLTGGQPLSDMQLFSQLRNLGEIKAALAALDNDTARRMVRQVDDLLESVFASSRFS